MRSALIVGLSLVTLTACATTPPSQRVGAFGCAPAPLTATQIDGIRRAQAAIKQAAGAVVPVAAADLDQVNQYLGRCGTLDPLTGAPVL